MCRRMERKADRFMLTNRLAGIVLFVLLALHSLAVVARSLQRLKWQPLQHSGALEVNIVLSDSAIQASQTTFALGVPYHCVVKNRAPGAQEFLIIPALEQ